MGKSTKKIVDVLSDEGHKRLKKMKKNELIDLIENVVVIYRLRFAILESVGIDYKKVIECLERDY